MSSTLAKNFNRHAKKRGITISEVSDQTRIARSTSNASRMTFIELCRAAFLTKVS